MIPDLICPCRNKTGGVRFVPQVVPDCQQKFNLFFGELAPAVSVGIFVAGCATDYPAVKQRKVQMIKARVSTNMKRGIDDLANQRGESEAVIIREALSEYLKKSAIAVDGKSSSRRKKRN
jgi:hypothetical protein